MYYYYCHLFELERAILLLSSYAVVIVFEKNKIKKKKQANKNTRILQIKAAPLWIKKSWNLLYPVNSVLYPSFCFLVTTYVENGEMHCA